MNDHTPPTVREWNDARAAWLRSALAVLSVPLLAAPSAYGVYTYLEPQSGPWAAGSAALGYEVLYIGVNILRLHSERLRAYGRNVALAAVATAVVFNTLAHYRATVPDIAHTAVDWAALGLALLTSLPLAGLAYAVSVLLHRLTEQPDAQPLIDSLSSELAETRAALDALRTPTLTVVDAPAPQLVDGRPEIVRWKDDDGMSFDAIGKRLSITRQAAQARYRRAKGE